MMFDIVSLSISTDPVFIEKSITCTKCNFSLLRRILHVPETSYLQFYYQFNDIQSNIYPWDC